MSDAESAASGGRAFEDDCPAAGTRIGFVAGGWMLSLGEDVEAQAPRDHGWSILVSESRLSTAIERLAELLTAIR